MNSKAALIACAAIIALTAAGAQPLARHKAAVIRPPAGRIRFIPVDMFPGDLARLKSHLEISGACYKVEYSGPETMAELQLETWENGKSGGYSSSYLELKAGSDVEVSISVKPTRDADGKPAMRIVDSVSSPSGASTAYITSPLPKIDREMTYRRELDKVAEFSTNQEIGLWAELHVTVGVPIDDKRSIIETAKQAAYAQVWKLVPAAAKRDKTAAGE